MSFEPFLPQKPKGDWTPGTAEEPSVAENGTFDDEVSFSDADIDPVIPEEADLGAIDESLGVDEEAEDVEDWDEEEDDDDDWDVDDDEDFDDDDFDDEDE